MPKTTHPDDFDLDGDDLDGDDIPDGHNAVAIGLLLANIEAAEAEKASIASDIKELYSAAKSQGYDVKTLRWVVSQRRRSADVRAEEQALRDLYAEVCGL